MQINEKISDLIQGLHDDYNNNKDINLIKVKITQINQLLSELEQDHYDYYEYLKYQQSEICEIIFERQNDQRSVSQYQKLKNFHLSGYQQYQKLNDNNQSISQQTQSYDSLDQLYNSNSLDVTQAFFPFTKSTKSEILNEEEYNQVVKKQQLLAQELEGEDDQSNNNLTNEIQNELENNQQGIRALVQLQNKQAETHELGIMLNGIARIGIKEAVTVLNIAKGATIWGGLVVATGVAAFEAVVLLKKYYKFKKENKDEGQRQIAKEMLIKQFKSLGIKTFSNIGLTTASAIGGSIVGSCIVPVIGTFVGSLLGIIVGTILSFVADSYMQNSMLSEKKLIEECEKDLGLEEYKKFNQQKYTKEEVEKKYKQYVKEQHPDKYPQIGLKKLQRYKLQKVQFAYEMIKQHNNWN
ncbi:DnaJ domain protein (macronuclear) [Tetrahymena thermophila SB210]|uniref:DnaJ domain protein n=1 Tax=Tetrahymena thermophila (strain SB210) TaxID=312017 RepID=Q22KI2_TETTS|nr:DnaJ domain protein [Tetrahymena thermophila SB210]EAR85817.1 DnaJ domain protein [Tetrahymena thermophila SB210]|eukprot:XP_001033480.1 DnaJ domain protein [Tetrahymena thermophila SB210]